VQVRVRLIYLRCDVTTYLPSNSSPIRLFHRDYARRRFGEGRTVILELADIANVSMSHTFPLFNKSYRAVLLRR
jgi:hypothetical protein